MKYSDLSGKFDGDRNQHNIMTIVGNGFDINMLTKHGYELPNGQKMTTSYPLFYSNLIGNYNFLHLIYFLVHFVCI